MTEVLPATFSSESMKRVLRSQLTVVSHKGKSRNRKVKQSIANSSSSQYATAQDFRQTFDQDKHVLHRLSRLLAVADDMAEQCVRSALEECLEVNGVYRKFARSWARRSVVINAIRLTDMGKDPDSSHSESVLRNRASLVGFSTAVGSVIALHNLPRFVFVMSALEQYTDHECSILLRCSHRDVCEARTRAFRYLEEACGACVKEYVSTTPATGN